MAFRATATVAGVIALVLGLGYLFVGNVVVGRWQLEATEGVLLLGRRMGALYLGLASMCFLARSAGPSASRSALCAGATIALALLAVLGIYEWSSGRASGAILISVAVEALLAIAFARHIALQDPPALRAGPGGG
jgi:hypothetical protein